MRAFLTFIAGVVGAVAAASIFAYGANFVFAAYLIGYSPMSVFVVSAIFGLLCIAPLTIWHCLAHTPPSAIVTVILGILTGVALYIVNVRMGMAGHPLSAFGMGITGAFGGTATIGALIARHTVRG